MISFLKSANRLADFPTDKKEIVFVGRSNAGKSTLINALYKKGLAYTGKTPGKTKMINFFDNETYYVVDVPGYGFANRNMDEQILFGQMMEEYFSRKQIALCVMITDARLGLTNDDKDMMDFLIDNHINFIIVANKIDKLSNNELNNNKRKYFNEYKNIYYVSAEKRIGLESIKEKINSVIKVS